MSDPALPVTDGSDNADSLSQWQELVRERFVALDIRPGGAPAFKGSVSSNAVGPLAVSSQPRSLAHWIRFRRLERARTALTAEPDRPVAVIAARYCFFESTVFARAFRDEYGVSPRDYRRTGSG